ncbi:MAG: peptidase domain-containing ABC transporter [Bacteroidales bacterium]
MRYPFFQQRDSATCGPTCLKMIVKFYGKELPLEYLLNGSYTSRTGTTLLSLSDMAESIGFRTKGVQMTFERLNEIQHLPCIAQWNANHFVVIYRVTPSKITIGDPVIGIVTYSKEKFLNFWYNNQTNKGVALLLETKPVFLDKKYDYKINQLDFSKILVYLKPHKRSIIFSALTILIGATINLVFPIFMQLIVDIGIKDKDIDFVLAILLAQMSLVFGLFINRFVSNWIILNMSSRLSISLIDDFLYKLMKLPISFFDRRNIGDLLQRINDFSKIEGFLTTSIVSIIMAIISFIPYSIILFGYGKLLLLTFVTGGILYVLWILFFLKKRKRLNYMQFQEMAKNQSNVIELINGMQEIKLNRFEKTKRLEWQKIQIELFNIKIKGLSLEQFQVSGGVFIDQLKNIIISLITASAVINGEITLGVMLAVQFIVGQMSNPLSQVISFIRDIQDTKISMERVNEINIRDEEKESGNHLKTPCVAAITIYSMDFHYNGPNSPKVIDNLSLSLKPNTITAIIGASGSGKTTLMKILLGIYEPTKGEVLLNNYRLSEYNLTEWRNLTAAVMQDGYIFTDSISKNIAMCSEEEICRERVEQACKAACIDDYINSLPSKYETIIGTGGKSLSVGQKQRLLIARAIYKNAPYLFLDEATNSLDANNELQILKNLNHFYAGKTVIIIAHRLSTVKNADNIIVLSGGKVVEQGKHNSLINKQGEYYKLIKNQLELGG